MSVYMLLLLGEKNPFLMLVVTISCSQIFYDYAIPVFSFVISYP